MVLHSSLSLSLSLSLSPFLNPNNSNNNLILNNNNNNNLNQYKHKHFSCCAFKPTSQNTIFRRDFVLFGLTSLSLTTPLSGTLSLSLVLSLSLSLSDACSEFAVALAEEEEEEEPKMASFEDELNAYSYLYPIELPSKKFVFKWVESRKPERYSSAAPLSPDARLRIVSERVDIIDNFIISVTIGPPNSSIIKTTDKSKWTAKEVADSVLSDKSALRVTSSQRLAESSVLDTHSGEIDGEPYWYYEYLVRKSPIKVTPDSSVYRHYIASTAERDGYFYSISASTLSPQWEKMGAILEKTVSSFRLLKPTENYVPPYKDPWRFW
ncbi:PsbP domain-containing protein 5, chloroplastic [Stylosanthes scabra]|uniref:PsbP domain-containing protein 5, chloroplastic n=1 Tax=Stylosanthes scabra TaxID=79078 RepID=A0ABU6YE22_9FABA|nr:PsbP domain-containing protein 5, chloroplastic [Stylosanthes scabra]